MQKVGLVRVLPGIKIWAPFSASGRGYDGRAARLRVTPELVALAAAHNVTAGSVARDWPISRVAETMRPEIAHNDLVICRHLLDDDELAELPPDQEAEVEKMRAGVSELNQVVQRADMRGCFAPAFRRIFRHDLRLHGRLYAVGANNIQNMSPAERRTITINGEPVVEVDVHASQLTVFLGLTGFTFLPDGDLYDLGGFPREVVKEWVVQTFAKGSPIVRWSDRSSDAARAVRPNDVRAAVISPYPQFAEPLRSIVPFTLLRRLPEHRRDWAVGQYLTYRESQAVFDALGYVLSRGYPRCRSMTRCWCRRALRGTPGKG
jgi:hypothetical protein